MEAERAGFRCPNEYCAARSAYTQTPANRIKTARTHTFTVLIAFECTRAARRWLVLFSLDGAQCGNNVSGAGSALLLCHNASVHLDACGKPFGRMALGV